MNYISIDIGGTAIKAGVIDSEGEILHKMSVPTPKASYDALFHELCQIVEWAKSLTEIHGIAVSQPCATDSRTGQALSEGALIYISGTNPAKRLGEHFGLPYAAENDGNCAALAEVWIGNAKDVKNVALVVCGTGIGGSVIVDQKIISGKRNFAGEFGFFIAGFEPDGRPMTWSGNGSTTALINTYSKVTGEDVNRLNGIIIFERAEAGEEAAMKCVDDFYRVFAYGVHNIQHVYDPERILVGGAVSARPDFISRIEAQIDTLHSQLFGLMSKPELRVCACGADANLIGAVYLLLHSTD